MSKQAHTPGPWKATGLYNSKTSWSITAFGTLAVATTHNDCAEANARLIAEAPATLAALRGAKERFEYAGDTDHPAYWDTCAILARIDGGVE